MKQFNNDLRVLPGFYAFYEVRPERLHLDTVDVETIWAKLNRQKRRAMLANMKKAFAADRKAAPQSNTRPKA